MKKSNSHVRQRTLPFFFYFPAKIVASSTPTPPPRRLDIHFFVFISQLKKFRQLTISLEIKVELHSLNIPTTNKLA